MNSKVRKPVPKRAIPSKPLPSRPLPSGPSPPAQVSQPQPAPVREPEPEPQQVYEPEPEPQPEPEPEPEPKAQPPPQEEQKQLEPEAQTQSQEASPSNNNWYKPREKKQKSYRAAKTCKLLLDDKKRLQKKVKLFQTFDKFFVAEGNAQNKGFGVASITNNEFGTAFKKMRIEPGWRVIKIGNQALPYKGFPVLKNQIFSMGQKAGDKGYYLVFDGSPEEEKEIEEDHYDKPQEVVVSAAKSSVQLITSYSDHKVVKVMHSLNTYVDFAAVKGPKGYKISGFKAKFGSDLKQHGIDIDWRVIKVGDKDVANKFTQSIRTDLDVEWKKNQANGLTLTFGQPL